MSTGGPSATTAIRAEAAEQQGAAASQTASSPARTTASGNEFITALESVRGIAAVAVLLVHACSVLADSGWSLLRRTVWSLDTGDELIRRLILTVFNGNAAVSLFFVLSGFVLALSLRRDRRSFLAKAGAFTARRFLRIYPALAVNLVLTAAVLWALSRMFPAVSFARPTASELGANLLLVDFKINNPTWTMLVELLAIPLLILCHLVALRFRPLAWIIAAGLGLAFFLGDRVAGRLPTINTPFWEVVYAYVVDYQFMFALGFLIAEWRARGGLRVDTRSAAIGLGVAVVLLLNARALFGFAARSSVLIEGLAAGTIVAILSAGPRIAAHALLEWPPVRFLGRVSYSLYLYHATALALIMPTVGWMMTEAWVQARPYSAAATIAVAALLVTVPFAWASYVLVERPAMRLGRSL